MFDFFKSVVRYIRVPGCRSCSGATSLKRFLANERGTIFIMAGFIIPIVVTGTMFSVEMAKHQSSVSAVRKVADSALMIGTRSMSEDLLNLSKFNENKSNKKAQALTESAFRNMSQRLKLNTDLQDLKADFVIGEDSVEGTLSYRGKRDSLFGLFKNSLFKVEIDATAIVPIRQRIDFHFVIDNSASMQVGASQDDQRIMIQETGCAFACHRGGPKSQPDYLRSRGANMRIDVVAHAVSEALEQFREISSVQAEVYVGLHTFSNTAETPVELTNDLDDIADALAVLDTVNRIGQGGTNYHVSFGQISDSIKAADRAPNAILPSKRYVILLTDGIGGSVQWTHPTLHRFRMDPDFRTFQPRLAYAQGLDPNSCRAFKDLKNTQVAVMELEYLPAGRAGGNVSIVEWFVENVLRRRVGTNVHSCASSEELVYRADDDKEIQKNVEKMISDVIKKLGLRLTR